MSAARRRQLKRFIERAVLDYGEARDLPAMAGTSRLSPHLHFGEISPRQVWHAIGDASGPRPLRSGVAQRQVPRRAGLARVRASSAVSFPAHADEPLRAEFARFPWREDDAALRAWQRGRTGIPLVDAGMRELWATGWMHNRVRMVVASFLVKNLLLPWQEGARWFWDTLVDADLANNTLGWQWIAGCGADAAPYFRVFNPVTQGEKFDPDGDYVRRWVPEAGTSCYPPPIVDLAASRAAALAAFQSLRAARD